MGKISVVELSEDPEAKFFDVPEEALLSFGKSESVWTSLYRWMENEGLGDFYVLHNLTYAGDVLMKKLLKIEKARLRKKHGISGTDLTDALSWSDLNAGPQTQRCGHSVRGDGAIVYSIEGKKNAEDRFFASR